MSKTVNKAKQKKEIILREASYSRLTKILLDRHLLH